MKLKNSQNTALYIFFFSINFEVWDPLNTGGSFSISKLTGFLYFATLLPQIEFFLKKKGYIRFLRPLWIFFIYLTLISFLNINSLSSSYFNFSIFQNIVLFVLLINHARRTPGILQKAFFSFALGSFALSVFFILNIGVTYDLGRIRLFGDNENEIGLRMCVSLIYLLFLITKDPLKFGKKKYSLIFLLPSMLSLLVATGSRVAFISFALCFLAGLAFIKTRMVHTKIMILVAGIIIGILIMNYVLSSEILYQRLVNSVEEQDLSDRNIIWKTLIPLIRDNVFFGVGIPGYEMYCFKVFGRIISPHNVIIEVLCYTGIIGLTSYLWLLYKIGQVSWQRYKLNGNLIQLILLIPVLGMILSGQQLMSKISWVLFAFAVSRSIPAIPFSKSRNRITHKQVVKFQQDN